MMKSQKFNLLVFITDQQFLTSLNHWIRMCIEIIEKLHVAKSLAIIKKVLSVKILINEKDFNHLIEN